MDFDYKEIISAEEISTATEKVATAISADYHNKEVLAICILSGAVYFFSDLTRLLSGVRLQVDFMKVSSYGQATASSGTIKLEKNFSHNISGRHLLIIEDIVDSGLTLDWLLRYLQLYQPQSIKICAVISNQKRRITTIEPDYCCFRGHYGYLAGYGLDYKGDLRNLPNIVEIIEKA